MFPHVSTLKSTGESHRNLARNSGFHQHLSSTPAIGLCRHLVSCQARAAKGDRMKLPLWCCVCGGYQMGKEPKWPTSLSGWWFGTVFIFPYIGNLIIPIDFHIFQRGGPTTNQLYILLMNYISYVPEVG